MRADVGNLLRTFYRLHAKKRLSVHTAARINEAEKVAEAPLGIDLDGQNET